MWRYRFWQIVQEIRSIWENGTPEIFSELLRALCHTHTLSAASKGSLDHDRISDRFCLLQSTGFGFLSENSRFAELCEKCGIIFIGPPAEVIARMGNKQEARNTMQKAGIPISPAAGMLFIGGSKSRTGDRTKANTDIPSTVVTYVKVYGTRLGEPGYGEPG